MRVLYLFSGSRKGLKEEFEKGEYHGNGFWGMLDLPKNGVEADYLEPEQFLSNFWSKKIRRYISVYFIHGLFFWKFFNYDVIFSSTAFGVQFIFAFLGIKKPKWVMQDFGIDGLIGQNKTWRQKFFKFMVKRSAGIVTLSSIEKTYLENNFPEKINKIAHIPFGVNLNFFKPLGLQEKRQVFAVGQDPDRDWSTFFEAVKDLEVPIIVATREDRVSNLKPLPRNVSIRNFSYRELVEEYDRSAIVVVPLNTKRGNNNAMGCSVMCEALSVGRPLIITETKTTASYIKNGENGLLVTEGNVDEMREAIKKLLVDQELRLKLSKNAHEYAIKNLDIQTNTYKLAVFLKNI